jgi:hypothetical protein
VNKKDKKPTVDVCAKEPCPHCPWRTANRGRKTKHKVDGPKGGYGWFSAKNRQRLWAALKRGEAMICHPTDASDPRYGAPEHAQARECAGALILQQRELMVLDKMFLAAKAEGVPEKDVYKTVWRRYRKERPGGLTREGAAQLMLAFPFGSVPILGGRRAMGEPNLMAEVEAGKGKLTWPVPELGLGASAG